MAKKINKMQLKIKSASQRGRRGAAGTANKTKMSSYKKDLHKHKHYSGLSITSGFSSKVKSQLSPQDPSSGLSGGGGGLAGGGKK